MKNSGNEAKEYLKTKDITFSNAANYARFARKLAQIEPKKEQKTTHFVETNRSFRAEQRGRERDKLSATRAGGTGLGLRTAAFQIVSKRAPKCHRPGTVTNNGIAFANWASPQHDLLAVASPIGFGLVRRCR